MLLFIKIYKIFIKLYNNIQYLCFNIYYIEISFCTVQPMVWIENQLVGAYEGQTVTLECNSEAHPSPITYWTKPSNETIANGE